MNVKFEIRDSEVSIHGYPELEGRKGTLSGAGMAS